MPEPDELSALTKMIVQQPDHVAALKDFVWAVLSSRQFAENH